MQNPLEYNTQRELYGIRVSGLDLDPAGLESSFLPADDVNFAVFTVEFWRIARNLLHSRGSFVDSRSCLVVVNRADLAVLAQDPGEMRGICLVRGQFLLLAGPGKTPLPVRIARNLRHLRLSLANGAKFGQFASNSFYLSAKD